MSPVLEPLDRVGLGRAEEAHLHAGVAHRADQLAVHLHRADGVENDVALDAGAGLPAERIRHLDGDVAAPVGVRQEVHRLLGGADRVEVGGEDLVAVDQELGVVAIRDGRAGQGLGGAQEARLADVDLAAQPVAVTALAAVAQAVRRIPGRARRADSGRPRVARHLALPPVEPPCPHRRHPIRRGVPTA